MTKVKKVLANLISRVFDPIIEIPIGILLAIYIAVQEGLRWRFLGVLIFVDMVMPFIFMVMMRRNGQISDFDIRKRKERVPLYVFTMICHGAGAYLAYIVGKQELAVILGVFWILVIVFTLITHFWKISIHAGVNAALIVFFNVIFGWRYWWLLIILPIVGWARVYDKHHSVKQFVAGSILGGGVSLLALGMVGY